MVLTTTSSANDINKELHQLTDTVQDLEGNTYHTVTIGEQVWLAESLRSTKFQDGSSVTSGAIPKDDEKNLLKYGRLYNWHDVSDERDISPVGWRVATDDDWKQLERTVGMSEQEVDQDGWRGSEQNVGLQLKQAQAGGLFTKVDPSLVNKQNFFARAAGVKWNGFYITQGAYTEFWTASSASNKKGSFEPLLTLGGIRI